MLRDFIETFVRNRIIANDYIVVSQDDLIYSPTKAVILNNIIRNLQNYRPCNMIKNIGIETLQSYQQIPKIVLQKQTYKKVWLDWAGFTDTI